MCYRLRVIQGGALLAAMTAHQKKEGFAPLQCDAYILSMGLHEYNRLFSLCGNWSGVEAARDADVKCVELAAEELGSLVGKAVGSDALSRVVTPIAALAFQELRCAARRLPVLLKQVRKHAAHLVGDKSLELLDNAVSETTELQADVRKLLDAHPALGDAPDSLEARVRAVVEQARFAAWHRAYDMARRGGRCAQEAAVWAEERKFVPSPVLVDMTMEGLKHTPYLRSDDGYQRFAKAVENASASAGHKRSRTEFEADFCGFVEIE